LGVTVDFFFDVFERFSRGYDVLFGVFNVGCFLFLGGFGVFFKGLGVVGVLLGGGYHIRVVGGDAGSSVSFVLPRTQYPD
jgi:hypothetical protein